MDDSEVFRRVQKWMEHAGTTHLMLNKYYKLLDFVRSLKTRSCCNECVCMSCDALKVLNEIGDQRN